MKKLVVLFLLLSGLTFATYSQQQSGDSEYMGQVIDIDYRKVINTSVTFIYYSGIKEDPNMVTASGVVLIDYKSYGKTRNMMTVSFIIDRYSTDPALGCEYTATYDNVIFTYEREGTYLCTNKYDEPLFAIVYSRKLEKSSLQIFDLALLYRQ